MLLIAGLFIACYLLITAEAVARFHRTAAALLAALTTWTAWSLSGGGPGAWEALGHHLKSASEIVFFLMGAMTIVGLVDAHGGFSLVRRAVRSRRPLSVFWIVGALAFFLSPVLDNLTAAIVMMTVVLGLTEDAEFRKWLAVSIIVAVNAGGAWSAIGDVTTTMLWIGGQISAPGIAKATVLPSLAMFLTVQILLTPRVAKMPRLPAPPPAKEGRSPYPVSVQVLFLASGLLALLSVPILKVFLHMPPWFGIFLGMVACWTLAELFHRKRGDEARDRSSVQGVLTRLDVPTLLFFLGIILAVGALQASGVLGVAQSFLDRRIANPEHLAWAMGILSAIVDNVPLVAAVQNVYPLDRFPIDDPFWKILALTTGTGGSLLIIGSAAGVALMGMARVGFGWYLRRATLPVLVGYAVGIVIFAFSN